MNLTLRWSSSTPSAAASSDHRRPGSRRSSEGRGDVHTVLKIDRGLQPGCREDSPAFPRRGDHRAALPSPPPSTRPGPGTAKTERMERNWPPPRPWAWVSGPSTPPLCVTPSGDAAREEAAGHIQPRAVFTEEMREAGYEILAPQMSPIHFRFLTPLFASAGLRCASWSTRAAPPWRSA